jgi:hypothetical protein
MRWKPPFEIPGDFRPQERGELACFDLNQHGPEELHLFVCGLGDRLGSVLPGMEAPAGMELIRGLKRPPVPCLLVV